MSGMEVVKLLFTLMLIAVPILTSPSPRWGRLFLGTNLSALMLGAIFVARPIAEAAWGVGDFYTFDVTGGLGFADTVGLVAALGLAAGVIVANRTEARTVEHLGGKLFRQPHDEEHTSRLAVLLVALLGVVIWTVILTVKGGVGSLSVLVQGRSADAALVLDGIPTLVFVLPAAGSLAATAYICSVAKRRRLEVSEILVLLSSIALSAWANLLLGNRRFLLPSLLAPVIALVICRRGRLPKSLLPCLPLGLLGMAVLPFVRSSGARVEGDSLFDSLWKLIGSEGLVGTVQNFLTSFDTEMHSYIALVGPHLGSGIDYGNGRGTIGEFLQYPLPSRWSGALYSDTLLTEFFGGGCQNPVCPVASAPGTLLFDYGLWGVLLGMMLFGYFLRRIELKFVAPNAGAHRLALGAVISAFAPVVVRTNATQALWWTIYALVILALVQRFVVRRAIHSSLSGVHADVALSPSKSPVFAKAIDGRE